MVCCPTLKQLPSPLPGRTGWPWTVESKPLDYNMTNGHPWPKITIVTPSYNQAKFLEETIRSVLLQRYPNLEYIIIDGGSLDGSKEIIEKYQNHLSYWVSKKDRGQSNAINKGFEKATGDILYWINSDDCLSPNALQYVAQKFDDTSQPAWLIGSSELIDENSNVFHVRKPQKLNVTRLINWCQFWFPQQSTFWTKAMMDKVGNLDESLSYAMDLQMWIRMFRVNQPIISHQVLSKYRFHDAAKCTANKIDMLKEISTVIEFLVSEEVYQDIEKGVRTVDIISAIRGISNNYSIVYSDIISSYQKEIEKYKPEFSFPKKSKFLKMKKKLQSIIFFK